MQLRISPKSSLPRFLLPTPAAPSASHSELQVAKWCILTPYLVPFMCEEKMEPGWLIRNLILHLAHSTFDGCSYFSVLKGSAGSRSRRSKKTRVGGVCYFRNEGAASLFSYGSAVNLSSQALIPNVRICSMSSDLDSHSSNKNIIY